MRILGSEILYDRDGNHKVTICQAKNITGRIMSESGFFTRLNKFRHPDESDRAFARRLKIHHQYFYKWKRGRTPKPGMTYRLSKILGCDAGWLQFGKESGIDCDDTGEFLAFCEDIMGKGEVQ